MCRDSQRQAGAEIEVTPEMIGVANRAVKAWLDETENRLAIEEGGYGFVDDLVSRICCALGKSYHSRQG